MKILLKNFKYIFLFSFVFYFIWKINKSSINNNQVFAQQTVAAQLISTIDTSLFSLPALNPAPDPAGITFLPSSNHLLISDSEVDEMTIYKGSNLFEITLSGEVVKASNTLSFSNEPTGVTYNPDNGHYYFTDDDARRINDLNPGLDGLYGTIDDEVIFINTTNFGCTDPEGISYGQNNLFIACGADHKVFQVSLTGSLINSFDVNPIGFSDIEGVFFNSDSQTLFILDQPSKRIAETSISGNLIKRIDVSAANLILPGDFTIAPSSNPNDSPALKNLYIVDRGIDNGENPNENDGKIYEMSFPMNIPTTSPSPTTIPGNKSADVNKDGRVDNNDIILLLKNWGIIDSSRAEDLDSNGRVNSLDLAIIFRFWH